MLVLLVSCTETVSENKLSDLANTYVQIISSEKNIESFAALYADSILYSDPIWGATDQIKLDTLKLWFKPVFDPNTGWDFEINSIATDKSNNVFALKGYCQDLATGERRLITSWYKVKNGKIYEQTDLTPWSLNSLKFSPRFEEALKNYE
ncbi:MAG: nuclear transport factor 2 family protein [Fulvivirga sp.]|uniref:nuclear transport factor 2 family protein n=1 Tax=Fulvivirga sp. TaxID=1931237 RepID=UPI0032EB6009